MNEYRSVLERAGSNFPPLELEHDSIVHRRDRKRRNQRIAAGVVGIAFFVAAVLAVTTIGSSDQTQPANDGTGPSDPPCAPPPRIPLGCWFDGLPPEEAVPSRHGGKVIAQSTPRDAGFVYVYADGRVLMDATWEGPGTILEARLTRESLELVRSGDLKPARLPGRLQLPPLWEGEGRVYVAPRYAICYMDEEGNVLDPAGDLRRLLPPQVEALLSGKERTYDHVAGAAGGSILPATCFEVTLEEAWTVEEVFTTGTTVHDPAFERVEGGRSELAFVPVDRQSLVITFNALLPHGEWIARRPITSRD